jgi:hypothetical protein
MTVSATFFNDSVPDTPDVSIWVNPRWQISDRLTRPNLTQDMGRIHATRAGGIQMLGSVAAQCPRVLTEVDGRLAVPNVPFVFR